MRQGAFPIAALQLHLPPPSEEILRKLQKHNIQWVQGTLSEFIQQAKKVFGETPKSCSATIYPIRIHGSLIELDRTTTWNIKGKVKLIHQGLFFSDFKDPCAFFEGKDHSLVPYREPWVFPRKWKVFFPEEPIKQFSDIKSLIQYRTNSGSPSDNMVYALTGSAGSGKSVIGKKIAYEWYLTGNPVIYLDTNNVFIDYLAIQSLLDEFWTKYLKQLAPDQEPKTTRYLIVCDNCSLILPEIAQMSDHLTSEGKPIDILLIDRSSEITESTLKQIGAAAAFALDDSITFEERESFIEYFKGLNILQDLAALRTNLENPLVNDSFFALMYTSIRESQRNLKEIIISEYESKSPRLKKLYALTSLVQSFGLSAVQTIMTKSSAVLLPDALSNIRSGNLRDVLIFDESDQSFSAMHRVIAEIIRNHVFATVDELKTGLSQIIDMTTEGNIAEMSLVHKLLMECPDVERHLPLQVMEELYKQATKSIMTRPLFIQLANIQLKRGEYTDCKESIEKAGKHDHPIFAEPITHVFDVEGRLNLAFARDALKAETENEKQRMAVVDDAWSLLEKALICFNQAKLNPLLTPHPFLGLAQTYELMETLETDQQLKLGYGISALEIIRQLRSSAPYSFEPSRYLAIEQRIISKLSEANFGEIDALALFKKVQNPNGYAYLADKAIDLGDYTSALSLVDRGMELDKKRSLWLAKTKISVLKNLYPFDYDKVYETAMEFQNRSPEYFDLELTFELAKAQFAKGDYYESMKVFRKLDYESKGFRGRYGAATQDRWMEEGGKVAKVLTGKIDKMPSPESKGLVSSEDPFIPFPLPLRHVDLIFARQWTDKVTFEIVFNMRGPEASNVKQR